MQWKYIKTTGMWRLWERSCSCKATVNVLTRVTIYYPCSKHVRADPVEILGDGSGKDQQSDDGEQES